MSGFCRVCGSNLISHWGEQGGQRIVQCDRCELTACLPYPTQAQLTAMYNDPAWHSDRHYDGSGEDGWLRRAMYELDIADLERTIKPGGPFLDYGCAEGLFASMLSVAWSKYGYDISAVALDCAYDRGEMTVFPVGLGEMEEIIPRDFFRVIHLRGTLEHMLSPMEFVKLAHDHLQPGGWLVVSNTPNVGSRIARMFRGKYRWILPGEHVNMFTLRTMRVMAAEAGLDIVRTTYPYFGTPYAHVLRDLAAIPINLVLRRSSPPWWGDIFTVYMRKGR